MPQSPSSNAYSFGFLAASLRPELVGVIAEHFDRYRSWDRTRAAILESNALQCSSPASSARLELELAARLAAPAEPSKPGDPTPTPPPVATYVPASSLRADCKLPYLSTEPEIDEWLGALRKAAVAEVQQGKRISL